MTANKASELVDILNSNAPPEARLAAWLWIEDVIYEAIENERERIRKEVAILFRKG